MACAVYQSGPLAAMSFNKELLASLDSGSNIDEDLTAVAESYALPWWTFDEEPASERHLCSGTLVTCLEHHQKVTGIKGILPLKADKTKYTWSRHVSFLPEGLELDCSRCRMYRGVAFGLFDNFQDLRHHVSGLEVLYEARSDISMRRAAGFFQLYDAALTKESAAENDEGRDTSSTNKGKKKESKHNVIKQVQKSAADQLSELENHPSLKWTWGSDLTIDEVLRLKSSTQPFIQNHPHSGYNISLPWGRYGEESEAPLSPTPTSCEAFSAIDEDDHFVPELSLNEIPFHFTQPPLRNLFDEPPPFTNQVPINVSVIPREPITQTWVGPAGLSWLEPVGEHFVVRPPILLPETSDGI